MANRKWIALLVVFNVVLVGIVVYVMFRDSQRGEAVRRVGNGLNATPTAQAADVFRRASESPIVAAASAASPAVVAVGGTITQVRQRDPFFDEFFSPYSERAQRRSVDIPFVGSGVLIDREGHFVTNVHVVQNITNPFITLSDGRRVSARLIDKDNRVDIAYLKADLKNAPYAPMGDSESLVPGEWVIAIGNPFGDAMPDLRPTVTVGVVSALHRNYKADDIQSGRIYLDMIQTDAAINPGNSGGPLIDINGQIVGINTFIVSRTGGSVGIGFAIPINRVKAVVDEIRRHGRIRNYALDFDVLDLTPRVASMLGVAPKTEGAVVRVIYEPDGPAARAGLEVGDVVIQADQLAIKSRADLLNYFLSLQVGARIDFKVIRDGKVRTLQYLIEEYKQ